MKCPNCGEEMISALEFRGFYNWKGREMYYYRTTIEKCHSCNIEYDYEKDKWTIPDVLLPSEKQLNTVSFIMDRLPNLSCELLTKRQCWSFINKNLSLARKVRTDWITEEELEVREYDESMFY